MNNKLGTLADDNEIDDFVSHLKIFMNINLYQRVFCDKCYDFFMLTTM